MFKNVEKQSWTAVSHSAQILFWHVTTNKAGKCPDFLRKISSVFTLKMLNCPLQQRSLTLQRSCFFFFLACSVGTKHGWKLSVSSQEDSVVSCFEMLKHLVEQWSLAQRRSCFSSLYSSGFTRFEQRSLALQLSEVKDSRGWGEILTWNHWNTLMGKKKKNELKAEKKMRD